MLYQDYKQKMDKVVARWRRINRYRVPIIATIATILVLIAAYIFAKGMVYGATLNDDTIEYGSQPSFFASALFSEVRYEYYDESTGEWGEDVPYLIGEYRVRAITNGIFGERYGQEQLFKIVPKRIEVGIKGSVVVYGEVPDVSAELAYDDRVICGELYFDNTTLASTYVTPVKETVLILDRDGADVTDRYQVSVVKSPIDFDKRELVLTVENKDKIYDGTPLTHQVWEVNENGCVYGDVVVKVDGSFSSITNAGSVDNKGEFLVVRQVEGTVVDVTHQYAIKQIYGTLTVDKKEILIHADGNEYVYDGEEHRESGFTIDDSTPLIEGHTAAVAEAPAIVNVGVMENILILAVTDGEGNDATGNYCFTYDGASLKVIPKDITVITEGGTLVYDGFDHSFDGCSLESGSEILEGHRLIVKDATVIKDVQTAENVLTAGVLDGNGQDVSKNYNISYINGSIEIIKREITITSSDLNGIYSGLAQSANVVSSGLDELCRNHTIVAEFKNTVTECGDVVENDFTAIILDADGVDVTENYETAFVKGTMKLDPMPLYLISASKEKTYDASPLSCTEFTYAEDSGIIVEGHVVKYISAPSITRAGTEMNVLEIEIYDSEGTNKTYNYDIDFVEYGTLSVLQRKITVQALDLNKEYYDGAPVINPGYEISGEGVLPVETAEVSLEMEDDTHAGSWKNSVVSVFVYGEDGEDVTSCYDITKGAGTITIGKRPVTLVSYGFDSPVYYDGAEHFNRVMEIDLNAGLDIVEGEELIYTFLNDSCVKYATESVLNKFTVIGVFKGEENLTSNYELTSIYGELIITPRPVTFVSGSHGADEVIYDGSLHQLHTFEVSTAEGMGLVTGDSARATYYSTILDAGELPNEFEITAIYDINRRSMIGNYDISYVYGTLKVNKRPITLSSKGADKIYNGTSLKNETVVVGGMGLANWRERLECSNFATITNAGSINNTFDYVIYNRDGEDITERNYEVTEDFSALLVVNKRPVTVTVNSYEKVYDGKTLYPNGVTATKSNGFLMRNEGLLSFHTVDVDLSGEIYKVGSVSIVWENLQIVDARGGEESEPATGNYEITVIDGTLTITERQISIDLADQEKEYDAEPLLPVFGGQDVGGLGLAEGDRLEITMSGSQTDRGTSVSSVVEYKIFNSLNEDVTFCYDPTSIIDGTLTVTPRIITITVLDGYREYYNGGAVISEGFTVDRLLDGKGHIITLEIVGEQINVGASAACVRQGSVLIVDENGRDITFNYEYSSVDGVLTVEKKRPITVTSASDKFVYNGKPHANNGYEIGGMGLATEREEIELVIFGGEPMINAGVYDNVFTVTVSTVAGGEDTTDNYEITYVYGTITIEKISIAVTTGSASKIFDGTPLTSDEVNYLCPLLPENETIVITVTGSIVYVGTQKNTFEIKVVDENGQEMPSGNYEVIENLGTLTVEMLFFTVTSADAEKTYDGTPLTNNSFTSDWEMKEAYNKGVLSLNVAVSGSRTEIGRSNNTVVARVYDKNGNDVTAGNCEITYVRGKLTVYAQPIEFVSQSTTMTFNGNVISNEWLELKGMINKKEHTVKKLFASSTAENGAFVYAGEYVNEFTVDIVDKNGNSVLEFYPDIKYTYGTIKINPYAINITPVSQKEQYDGSTLYALQEIVMPNEYLDSLNGYNSDNVFTYFIDDLKDIYVSAPGEILYYTIPADRFHIQMNGVTLPDSCFNVTSDQGYIRLSSLLIEINVYTVTGTYNGRFIGYEEDEWYIRDDQLAKMPVGHRVDIKLNGGRTDAGTVDFEEMLEEMLRDGNIHVYDENGSDVTYSYDFKFVGTPLTVKEKFIQITAGSAEKVYDGTALVTEEYTITGGKLASGHTIKRCYVSGSQTEIGVNESYITGIIIVDARGHDVTDNYNIELIDGVLEVIPDPQDK